MLFLLGDALVRSDVGEALLLAPWPLLALWFVYVSAFASHLEVDDDAITVQNMLRVIRVPFARIVDMQWRWQVELALDDGTSVRSLGGPVQGRPGRRPGRQDQTPPTVQAQWDYLVRVREDAADRAGGSPKDPVRRGWDVPALIVLAVLVVWAGAALIVSGGPS
nr:hypothetical protein [Microbacterium bovistercoris]